MINRCDKDMDASMEVEVHGRWVRYEEHVQALAEKDQEIAQWKNTIRDEYVGFLAESKENLLQQYVNLTQMYGEQKHEIRRLLAVIAEKDREIAELKEWKSIILGTGTDQEAVIRMAAAEYTQVAVQTWKQAYHALMAQAVLFAKCLADQCKCPSPDEVGNNPDCAYSKVGKFLDSPEVREWREREEQP